MRRIFSCRPSATLFHFTKFNHFARFFSSGSEFPRKERFGHNDRDNSPVHRYGYDLLDNWKRGRDRRYDVDGHHLPLSERVKDLDIVDQFQKIRKGFRGKALTKPAQKEAIAVWDRLPQTFDDDWMIERNVAAALNFLAFFELEVFQFKQLLAHVIASIASWENADHTVTAALSCDQLLLGKERQMCQGFFRDKLVKKLAKALPDMGETEFHKTVKLFQRYNVEAC